MKRILTIDGLPPLVRRCLGLLALAWLAGCAGDVSPETAGEPATEVLRLATTTSTRDSGLLEKLLPVFQQSHNCRIDVVAVGTGAALKLGAAGDVDVVLVHARRAEEAFMRAGHGIRHEELMYNDFVILGPPDDPANIRAAEPLEGFRAIAAGEHPFVSRGDDSGTHKRELLLWEQIGGRPEWSNYIEAGQGMGKTLIMADELRAYVLSDRGTFLNFRDKIDLIPLSAPSEKLRNVYAVMVVDPDKNELMNGELADELVSFLISRQAQEIIRDYRLGGQQLFYPLRLENK